MRIPDFFIVGAPKCGTTALYSYLKDRPDVFMPELKEPHFFASDFAAYRPIAERDLYLELFAAAAPDAMLGEASVWYLFSEVAVPDIMRANPAARIIVMLRNPVDMVHALHGQLLHALDEDVTDFERAWALQQARTAGRDMPRHCRESRHLQYRAVASYAAQIERLRQHVPQEQVLVLLYEDFAGDTAAAYAETLRFLGLPQDGRQSFERVNASRARRSRLLATALRDLVALLGPTFVPARRALNAVGLHPGRAVVRWNDRPQARTPLSPRLRAELVDAFREDVDRLEPLLGRSLDVWRASWMRAADRAV
jgi:Sulfotransferase domain